MAQAVALAVSCVVGFDVGLSGGVGLVGYPIGGEAPDNPILLWVEKMVLGSTIDPGLSVL